MFRRNFLGLFGIFPFVGTAKAKVVTEPTQNAQVLRVCDNAIIITTDPALLKWGGQGEVCVVHTSTYNLVKKWVDENEHWLKPLMVQPRPGITPYWEDNHHDRILKELSKKHPEHKMGGISNALAACGY